MNDAQLARIQDEIMGSINKSVDLDSLIEDTAANVAIDLAYKNKSATIEFQNEDLETRVLMFSARRITTPAFKQAIVMTVADVEKYKKDTGYRPYIVTAEINHDYTLYESMKLTVNRFLRHFSGCPIADEMED